MAVMDLFPLAGMPLFSLAEQPSLFLSMILKISLAFLNILTLLKTATIHTILTITGMKMIVNLTALLPKIKIIRVMIKNPRRKLLILRMEMIFLSLSRKRFHIRLPWIHLTK